MRRTKKGLYIIFIVLFLLSVSVGYAFVSETLSINGTTEIYKNTWDIHFENITLKNGSVSSTNPPIIDNTKLKINFSCDLNEPGDFYQFTIDVVNTGTLDAMIDSVVKTPELTEAQKKYLDYTIFYENGEEITSKQLIKVDSFVRLIVRVEYILDITKEDLPTTAESLNLGFTVNYLQSDGTGIEVDNNGKIVKIISGDGTNLGDEVCIGNECFNVIGTDGDNVKLFAKHNLNVGNQQLIKYGSITAIENPTGMQDENSKASHLSSTMPLIGITPFTTQAKQKYSGSFIETYFDNYASKLETLYNINVLGIEMLKYDDLPKYGCSIQPPITCADSPHDWLFTSAYWIYGQENQYCYYIYGNNGFNLITCSLDNFAGARPVIIISNSYLN